MFSKYKSCADLENFLEGGGGGGGVQIPRRKISTWQKLIIWQFQGGGGGEYLIVNLVFSRLSFWSGNFFLIAPFPDHCLLVPF